MAYQPPSPPPHPASPVATHIFQVHQAFTSLLPSAHSKTDLGGQLLYAAELDSAASSIIRGANIAGVASLAASSNSLALRQAQREGVIDFLVNTLDEALRILKNEIRKRQPVAVAVSLAPQTITQEMLDRGVLPDLLPPESSPDFGDFAPFLAKCKCKAPAQSFPSIRTAASTSGTIPTAYTNRPADFEAILEAHLSPADQPAHRWLHMSPRYFRNHGPPLPQHPHRPRHRRKTSRKIRPPAPPIKTRASMEICAPFIAVLSR